MSIARAILVLLLLAPLFLAPPQIVQAQTLDQYGGYVGMPAPGGATGFFRVEKIGNRWMFVTPAGNAFWMAGVYLIDVSNSIPDQGVSYDQIVAAKYPDKYTWANQTLKRIQSWGFNSAAEYASAYVFPFGRPTGALLLPLTFALNASHYAFTNNGGYAPGPVKGLEDCLDLAVYTGYVASGPPDVYDPNFDAYWNGRLLATTAEPFWRQLLTSPWVVGLTTDDTDYFQGFGPGLERPGLNGVVHIHIGWLALAVSPTKTSSAQYGVTYPDPTVYTKKAVRDFLAKKYGTIAALNAAWGSTYTTFDSAGGWGGGTGLMDENGRHTAWLGDLDGTLKNAAPSVVADLDAFLYEYAVKYFSITAGRIRQYAPNHLVFGPAVLNGHAGLTRAPILRAAGQFVDVVQAGISDQQLLDQTVQALGDKPIVTWEGTPANPDSTLWRYPNLSFGIADQATRGSWYAARINMLLTTQSTNGYPIVGFKFWAWSDSWGEKTNWGLVSFRDNAYDGREAVMTAGADPWGYLTGGEERDYGNFLGPVVTANKTIATTLTGATSSPPPPSSSPPPSSTTPTVSITAPTNGSLVSGSVSVTASATDTSGITQTDLLLDGTLVGSFSGGRASYLWDTTKVPPGTTHAWLARAANTLGASAQSPTVSVTVVDSQPPAVSIVSPAAQTVVARRATVTITANATDNVGVSRVDVYVSGSLLCSVTTAPYSCAWKLPGAPGRSYDLQAKAYDARGNVGVSPTVTVISSGTR